MHMDVKTVWTLYTLLRREVPEGCSEKAPLSQGPGPRQQEEFAWQGAWVGGRLGLGELVQLQRLGCLTHVSAEGWPRVHW